LNICNTQNKQKRQNFIADKKVAAELLESHGLLWCSTEEIFLKTLLLPCVNLQFDVPCMGLLRVVHV